MGKPLYIYKYIYNILPYNHYFNRTRQRIPCNEKSCSLKGGRTAGHVTRMTDSTGALKGAIPKMEGLHLRCIPKKEMMIYYSF